MEQPKIKPPRPESKKELEETRKRLEQSGLPQDGQPEPQAEQKAETKPNDEAEPSLTDVQTGTPISKRAATASKKQGGDDPQERGDVLPR